MLNRRRFVYGIFSAGALGVVGRANAAQPTSLPSLRGRLSKGVFLGLLGQTFSTVIDERRVRFVLVEVTDHSCCRKYEQFTARFQGPRDLRLKDSRIVLQHATAGRVELYVQAAGTDERATYFQAPFNLRS